MRCLVCGALSLPHICKSCQNTLLAPNLTKRRILKDLEVYSFYSYEEIEELLHYKYHHVGKYIYAILAKLTFAKFAQEFEYAASVVPIDARLSKAGYSHTAVLARAMATRYLRPRYHLLYATNDISYAGKSLEYRLANPRGFVYRGGEEEVILVDDVVTTGTTLKEAKSAVEKAGGRVLFALTLADAARD